MNNTTRFYNPNHIIGDDIFQLTYNLNCLQAPGHDRLSIRETPDPIAPFSKCLIYFDEFELVGEGLICELPEAVPSKLQLDIYSLL